MKLTGPRRSRRCNREGNEYVYSPSRRRRRGSFTWRDNRRRRRKRSYYYVRGEQNGEIVWVSPMWITYTGK